MKALKIFLVFGLLISFLQLSAEDYYWYGGQGTWSDLNSWRNADGLKPTTIPDGNDNVIFNATSFLALRDTVFVNTSNAVCNNMTWENIQDSVVMYGGMAGNASISVYGSITLHSFLINEYFGSIRFVSGDAGETITCSKSKFAGSIFFEGTGEWILQDTLFVYDSTDWKVIFSDNVEPLAPSPKIFHTNGTLNTNEQTVISRGFRSDGSAQRTLLADETDFWIGGNYYLKATPLIYSTNNVNIIMRGKMEHLLGDIIYYNDITFLGLGPADFPINFGSEGNIMENTGIRTDVRKVLFRSSGSLDGMKQLSNLGFFTIDTLIFEGGLDPMTFAPIPCLFRAYESDVHYSQVQMVRGEFTQHSSVWHRADFDGGTPSEFTGNHNVLDSLMFNVPPGLVNGKQTINNVLHFADEGILAADSTVLVNQINKAEFMNDGWILDNNVIDSLILSTGYWYRLSSDSLIIPGNEHTWSKIQHVGYIDVIGDCNKGLCTLSSSFKSAQAVLNYTGGTYPTEYIQVKDVYNQGDELIINNGIDLGNNENITITDIVPRNLYWVGDGGYWSDSQHWSTTSGGPGGECPPTLRDNVFFDANSGFTQDTLIQDTIKHIWCHDMHWSDDIVGNPVLTGAGTNSVHIWGSLKLSPSMVYGHQGKVYFEAEDTDPNNWNTIDIGHTDEETWDLYNDIHFYGLGGRWTLESKMYTNNDTIYLTAGHLEMTRDTIGSKYFMARDTLVKGLYMYDTCLVEVYAQNEYAWVFNAYDVDDGVKPDPNTYFWAGTSTILLLGDNPGPGQPTDPYGPCHFQSYGDSIRYFNIQFHTPAQLYDHPGKAVASVMQSDIRNAFHLVDYYCLTGQTVGTGWIDTLTYKVGSDFCMLMNNYDIDFAMVESEDVLIGGTQFIDTLMFFQRGILEGGNQIRKYMEAQEYVQIRLLNTIEEAVLLDNALITGKNTFFRLQLNPGSRYLFGHETGVMDTTIIVNDWDANGYCDSPIRLESDSVGNFANIQYFALDPTYPEFAINNSSIRDLKMLDANGGSPYIANNTVDLGHNENWDFVGNSGNVYYWIGGQGDWGEFTNWSYTSGGPPLNEECTPKENNTVIFDDESFFSYNDTVTLEVQNAFCNDMRWIHTPGDFNPTFLSGDTNRLFVYGSVELNDSMDYQYNGFIHFDEFLDTANEPDTIYSKGNVFRNDLIMQGIGDAIILDDTLRTLAVDTIRYAHVILEHGRFDLNEQTVDIAGLHSIYKNERIIDISNSHLYFREPESKVWTVDATDFELDATNSTMFVEALEGVILTAYGDEPLEYHNIVLNKPGDSIANVYNTTIYNDIIANGADNVVTSVFTFENGDTGQGDFIANNIFFNKRNNLLWGTSVTDTVIFADTSGVIAQNHQINFAVFYGPDGEIIGFPNTPNKFERCDFYSSGTFRGTNEFDTLHLFAGVAEEITGDIGNEYKFVSGTEQIIYDSLFLRGNHCARISITSINGSGPAFLRKDQGIDVQCDFIIINNVGAKSDNIDFYAGANTIKPNPEPEGWIFANNPQYVYGFQGEDIYFCEGDQITLDAGSFNGDPNTNYYWNYSMYPEGPNYTVNSTEPVHILVEYFEGCFVEDDIFPKYDQAPIVGVEPGPFCDGDPIHLTISPTDHTYSYEWFNQETTPTIVSDLAYTGDIWVKVKDLSGPAGCSGTGEQTIQVNPYPDPQTSLGPEVWLNFGEEVTLNAGEGDEYVWISEPETVIAPDNQQEITVPGTPDPIEYTVNVGLEGCYKEGLITVNMYPYSSIGIPTAFSPNGDGANDVLEVKGSGFSTMDFRIYNRYGEEVFSTSDWSVAWDGTHKGQKQEMDVYTYYIKVVYEDAGVAEEKGNITLIR